MKRRLRVLLLCSVLVSCVAVAREIEVERIDNAQSLNLLNVPLGCKENGRLYYASGNRLISVEDVGDTLNISYSLSDSIKIDDFCFLGDNLLFRDDNALLCVNNTGSFVGFAFENGDFTFNEISDSTFFMIVSSENSVLEFSLRRKNAIRSLDTDEQPVTAGMFGNSIVLVSQHGIYITLGNTPELMHHHPWEIRAAAVTDMGIYFGTDQALWRLVGEDRLEHVADGTIARIYGAGNILYVIDGGGSLFKFTLKAE